MRDLALEFLRIYPRRIQDMPPLLSWQFGVPKKAGIVTGIGLEVLEFGQ